MLENCHVAQFLKGGDHALLQNVTVHIGVHVSFSEPQLPNAGSTHVASDHDTISTMLDCRQDTIIFILLTRATPHWLDIICAKQLYLSPVRPQNMAPVIHAL